MQKINLIPEVKQQQIRQSRMNVTATTIAIVTAIILGTVIIVLLGYIGTRKAQILANGNEIKNLNNQLKAYSELENTVLSLETGLKEIKSIINNDSKWMEILAEIEKSTPQDIRFSSLSVQQDGTASATLVGKDVASIDRFIRSFSGAKTSADKNAFSAVEVDSYTTDGTKVNFSAKFKIDKGAF